MPVDPYQSAQYGVLYGDALYSTFLPPTPPPVNDPPLETAAKNFDGDALFYQTGDGGEIQILQGLTLRSGGLRNAVFLSWFGANEEDTGLPNSRKTFWANRIFLDTDFHYRGQLQRTLNTLPMVSANLPVIEAVAVSDLDWMVTLGVADSVEVTATIVGPKRVKLVAEIQVEGEAQTFTFYENWAAQS